MSTTDNVIPYDVRFAEQLSPYLKLSAVQQQSLTEFVAMGLVQRDRLVEMAIANVGGHKIVSINGQDFCDGSDSKSVVSTARNNDIKRGRWTNSFSVKKIRNKTGPLRIVAYNKMLDNFQYFFVPFDAYKHLTAQLDIIIESYVTDNTPTFTGNINVYSKWWDYECNSFEEMCLRA